MYDRVFRVENELPKLDKTMEAEGEGHGEKLKALAPHPPG